MQLSENQLFTKKVLVVGRNELNLASVINFLYESGYDSIGVLQKQDALRFFEEHEPHILIFSNLSDEALKIELKNIFYKKNPTLTFFEHFGGISALKLLIENNSNV